MRRLLAVLALATAWANSTAVAGGAADCDGSAQLRALLASSGLRQQLMECTTPLLLVPFKWAAAGASATEYCEQDACRRVAAALNQLPSCTWMANALRDADDDDAVRMARQVRSDCGGGVN